MDQGRTLLQTEKLASNRAVHDRARGCSSGKSTPVVLHVLDHSWPVLSGYSVRSRNLITAQHRQGEAIKVLTGPLHELDDAEATEITLDGVQYLRTPIRGNLASAALRKRWLVAREHEVVRLLRERILAVMDREPVRLIYAHSPALCGLAAVQAARRTGVPCVYEIRAFWEDAAQRDSNGSRSLRARMTHRLETFVAKRADAVAAIAKPMLSDLEARGVARGKLFHIPNGVDIDRFSPVARDEALAQQLGLGEGPVLGFFGSLYSYEGVSWMIRAASQLWARGIAFHILIIGRGEDESAIREAVSAARADRFVHTIPHVPHEEISRYYSVVDVVLCPRCKIRLTELVTPLKPLEAMALKKAVLGSDVGGIRELIEHEKTGLLFRAGDAEDFCRQANRLIQSPALRNSLAERGREFVIRHRDWQVLSLRYKQIYDFALQGRTAAN
jgi:glycogen synthase